MVFFSGAQGGRSGRQRAQTLRLRAGQRDHRAADAGCHPEDAGRWALGAGAPAVPAENWEIKLRPMGIW